MRREKSGKAIAAVHVSSQYTVAQPPSATERTGCLAGRQASSQASRQGRHEAGRQAGRQTSEQHPLPRVTQIINLAMFSRTFECGFRLETRLCAKISGNVRKRVQPYLRHAAVCLHPAMLLEPEWRVLMT
ncbi:hypothetical protein EAI_10870 [Harpegnathos saltator]|uniref:Uncharacterized protein n=1 Tax=Harpegnathos saltator TaxID=610380 RepID=E2B5V6_HARSA|nr:hypothetical protein EAI_10870 [Harpegnathos saltator]